MIMMIVHMSPSYFHKNSFHYFKDYLMTKLTLGYSNLIPSLLIVMKSHHLIEQTI
jgi:hypothetical protein